MCFSVVNLKTCDRLAERGHLVTVVFPELSERLEILGLELRDADLRWGVTDTGIDGERTNSWEYRRKWIDRVKPFFVSILAQRYGWAPSPNEHDYEGDTAEEANMSITEMEIRYAVLSRRLRRRNFFYFRRPTVPRDTPGHLYRRFVDEAQCEQ